MKILCMSDIHCEFDRFTRDWPECDLVVIAGDLTNYGCRKPKEVEDALDWLMKLRESLSRQTRVPIYTIPGNHDIGIKSWATAGAWIYDLAYERGCRGGLSFYGVPLTTAYAMPELINYWDHMTINPQAERAAFDFPAVDIVVSHGPPADWHGDDYEDWALDLTHDGHHCGSQALRDYILTHAPKLVICGHIHEGVGIGHIDVTHEKRTWVYNVARHAVLIDTDALGEWNVVVGLE